MHNLGEVQEQIIQYNTNIKNIYRLEYIKIMLLHL